MLGSATKLETARNITLTGDVTGSATFDGSKNVTVETSIENSTTQTAVVNTTKNDTAFRFIIKRNMNVVHINVELTMPSGREVGSGIINMDELLPDWAKCNGDISEFLGVGSFIESSSMDCFCRCDLSYNTAYNVKHRTVFSYKKTSTEEKTINFVFTYIV